MRPTKNLQFSDSFSDWKSNIFRRKIHLQTDIPTNLVRQNNYGRKGVTTESDAPLELFRRNMHVRRTTLLSAFRRKWGRINGDVHRMQRSMQEKIQKNWFSEDSVENSDGVLQRTSDGIRRSFHRGFRPNPSGSISDSVGIFYPLFSQKIRSFN